MLGYDLQILTVTQRPLAGHCEHGNVQMTKMSLPFLQIITYLRGYLRLYNRRRKDAVCIPDGVIGNFHRHNFSDRKMIKSSTQPLTNIRNRNCYFTG